MRLVQVTFQKVSKDTVKKLILEAEERLEATYGDFIKLSKFEVIPVEKLVKIQVASVLYSLAAVMGQI